jgi:hypothetical protein
MIARNETVIFSKSFLLNGVDRILPAGNYRVVTDEELSREFPFRLTGAFRPCIEMVTIDPLNLRIALDQDTARL